MYNNRTIETEDASLVSSGGAISNRLMINSTLCDDDLGLSSLSIGAALMDDID